MKPRVLVVEDEDEIAAFVQASLGAAGYDVVRAVDLRSATARFRERTPQLVILDLGLPDASGMEMIAMVRAQHRTPVIVLSAQTAEVDKIAALDLGADDYLTKPFGAGELLARVRVALRHAAVPQAGTAPVFVLDDLCIDVPAHRVTRGDRHVHLTPVEFRLLARLAVTPGRVVTHRQLLTDVWGAEYVDDTHYLRIHMGKLRAKLEDTPAEPRFLLTETGIGYRLAGE